jgi:VWFA-related protein
MVNNVSSPVPDRITAMIAVYRRLGIGLILAAVGGAALLAQSPGGQPTPQEAPLQAPLEPPEVTFKLEVNYVEVDAAVFDRQGQFVPGLKRADFEVLEEGVPQEVTSFTQVDIPIEKPEPLPLQATTAVEPDVVSNAKPFEGRVYVIILDDKHTAALRAQLVKRAAVQFINKYMAANDMAAVLTTSGLLSATQEFTSNKRLLVRAVEAFGGQKLRPETEARLEEYQRMQGIPSPTGPGGRIDDPDDMLRGYDARVALETIAKISDWVGSIRGRRKAIIWFSEGIDYNIYDFQKREASTIQEKMKDVIAAATRSDVSIYSIDPRGLTMLGDEAITVSGDFPSDPTMNLSLQSFQDSLRLAQNSLRSLSEETGGFAAVNTNDFTNAFSRVVKDNSAYYVLGYYPKNDRRDGRFRRIEVRVKRPGLDVRHRRGYTAPRGKAPELPKTAPGDKTSAQVHEALNSPLPISGLKLRAVAVPFKGAAPNTDVSITIEADGSSFGFTRKDGKYVSDFEVATIAMDREGKIRDGDRNFVDFTLKPENMQKFAATGVRLSTRLHVPPGRYQIRIGAREGGTGRVGTLNDDIDVPDFTDGPLQMSGIALAAGSGVETSTVKSDAELKAVLPGPPVASREFRRGDQLAVYAEVYDNDVKTPHKVDITTSVVSEDGRTVFSTAEARESSELQGKKGGYGHQALIATADMAPGVYILTVEAKSRAGKMPAASRQVQFRIR